VPKILAFFLVNPVVPEIRAKSRCYIFFPVHYSVIILSFETTHSKILEALLNTTYLNEKINKETNDT
jgi:hypothetical protein